MPKSINDNFYIFLELDIWPKPEEDPAVIIGKIDSLKIKWSKDTNNADKKHQCMILLEKISSKNLDALKRNIEDDNIRKKTLAEAESIIYGELDTLLSYAASTNEDTSTIFSNQVQAAAKQAIEKIPLGIIEKTFITDNIAIKRAKEKLRLNYNANELKDETSQDSSTYTKNWIDDPIDNNKMSIFVNTNDLLKDFQSQPTSNTLYDFLSNANPKTLITYSSSTQLEDLKARIKDINTKIRGNSAEKTITKHLNSYCETDAFVDDSSKKLYDRFLDWEELINTLYQAKTKSELSGNYILNKNDYDRILADIKSISFYNHIAEGILNSYLKYEENGKISHNRLIIPLIKDKKTIRVKESSNEHRDENNKLIVCRYCKKVNYINKGTGSNCKYCARDLKCPNCKNVNSADINNCGCGWNLYNISQSVIQIENAEASLNDLKLDEASNYLARARSYWDTNPRLDKFVKAYNNLDNAYGNDLRSLHKYMFNCNYIKAKDLYTKITNCEGFNKIASENGLTFTAIKKEINDAIQKAEDEIELAIGAADEDAKLEHLEEAYGECSDHPKIRKYAEKPEPPTVLTIEQNENSNMLYWQASKSKGTIRYHIIRSENNKPKTINDDVLKESVDICEFKDDSIKSKVPYYYAVFAERLDVMSDMLVSDEPVISLLEVSNLEINNRGTFLKLSWVNPDNSNGVVISRETDNDKQLISKDINETEYVDRNIENGVNYTYTVKTKYTIDGKENYSKGQCISAIANRPDGIKITKVTEVNGNTHISLGNIPDNVISFNVYSSKERFITMIPGDDPPECFLGAYTIEMYRHKNALVIARLDNNIHYLSVFSTYNDGDGTTFSDVCTYKYDNCEQAVINYLIACSKNTVTITFSSESFPFTLPHIDIRYRIGTRPSNRKETQPFYTVEEQLVSNEKLTISINKKDIPAKSYINFFLKDTDVGSYSLHLIAGVYKIS